MQKRKKYRYRVNYTARDEFGNKLRGVPVIVKSRRGAIKRRIQAATLVRHKLEREALGRRNSMRRLEEGLALKYLADVPSVISIARDMGPL